VLFPRYQGYRNLQFSSISSIEDEELPVASPSSSRHANDIQYHEDHHVTLSLENHKDAGKERYKPVPLGYADDATIRKPTPDYSWVATSANHHNEHFSPAMSRNSDIPQEAHGLPRQETGESRSAKEQEETEGIFNFVKEESPDERYYFGQVPISERFVEQSEPREAEHAANRERTEIQAYLSLINNKETQRGSVHGSQRIVDSTSISFRQVGIIQTTRQRGSIINSMGHHQQRTDDSTLTMLNYENTSNKTDYLDSETQKRAEHLNKYWAAENHKGGSITCLVCYKTLKRSYYMKVNRKILSLFWTSFV
jgi:hypothetical protein